MSDHLGKKVWAFPDAFLPAEGHPYKTTNHGDQFGHESLCIVNYSTQDANIQLDFLYEDQDPIENYSFSMKGKRSLHLRLDHLETDGVKLPREKPYSIVLKSDIEVVAQLSRLDTTSDKNAFMTTMGWGGLMYKAINKELIDQHNQSQKSNLDFDFEYLGQKLKKSNIDIHAIKEQIKKFQVAVPTWGVGTGGTRFARFPGIGEPQNIFDKIEDCAVINDLIGFTQKVSPHFPWDNVEDFKELKEFANSYGIGFDVVNSNTFQDPADGSASFKYGSLTNSSQEARDKAIEVNTQSIDNGKILGSKGLTVWVGDGGNFPGQMSFSKSLERYIDSMKKIYAHLPKDWTVLLEHKPYEPAFYSTVISDWGTSYICAKELGDQAMCLVDLGHHLPNTNIEMVVSRLIDVNKLGGFHFNDSKFGDDDLDAGSINPYELFLIFNELTSAAQKNKLSNIAYMIDQSHNVTDPIESLMLSANEIVNSYTKSLLVNYTQLEEAQDQQDPIRAMQILKTAFSTDASSLVSMARFENGHAIDPIAVYRTLDYKKEKAKTRKNSGGSSSGIV